MLHGWGCARYFFNFRTRTCIPFRIIPPSNSRHRTMARQKGHLPTPLRWWQIGSHIISICEDPRSRLIPHAARPYQPPTSLCRRFAMKSVKPPSWADLKSITGQYSCRVTALVVMFTASLKVRGVAPIHTGRCSLQRWEVQTLQCCCRRVGAWRSFLAVVLIHVRRFGRGEGVVSVVLKTLDAAMRDNDKIYATVRRLSSDVAARTESYDFRVRF